MGEREGGAGGEGGCGGWRELTAGHTYWWLIIRSQRYYRITLTITTFMIGQSRTANIP